MIVLIIMLYIVFKIGLAKVFQKAGKNWILAFINIKEGCHPCFGIWIAWK